MPVQMLQGVIPDMSDMNNLGNEIGGVINPNAKYLNALKAEVIKDPSIRQQYVDMEAKNPGTLRRLFGPQANSLFAGGTPSIGAQSQIFAAANPNMNPTNMGGTLLGDTTARTLTGSTPDELKEQASRTKVAGNQATISDASVQPALDKAKLEDAQSLAELNELPTKIASQHADLARNIQDKMLLSQVEANPLVSKMGGIIPTLLNHPEIMPDAAKSAIMNDNGYYRLYNEAQTTRRYNLMEARDDARDAKEKATIDDQIMKQDAANKSALAAKFGLNVEADDMYNIKKLGLVPVMDSLVRMNAAQLHQAAESNPAIDQIIQHPSMVQSWQHWQAATQQMQDKDVAAQRKDYNTTVNQIQVDLKKGVGDPSFIQSKINDITSHPYADIMNSKGTPLPIPHYDSGNNGVLSFGKHLYFTDPHTGQVLKDQTSFDSPTTTPAQAQTLDALATSIANGQATYEETIKDKRFASFGKDGSNQLATLVAKKRQALLAQPKSGTPISPK